MVLSPSESGGAHRETDTCTTSSDHTQLLVIPETPSASRPIRVLAVTRDDDTTPWLLAVATEDGDRVSPTRDEAWGVTPRALSHYFPSLKPGTYRARLSSTMSEKTSLCLDFEVVSRAPEPVPDSGVWTIRHSWNAAWEDVYSVFIAKLFHVERGSRKGWKPLHQAARDPFRNILYGMLGWNEDHKSSDYAVKMEPDCGDAPYQIRAYFAWKMGLPFMFHRCNRGTSVTGPDCNATHSNLTKRFDDIDNPVLRFNDFAAVAIGWKVHSGNGRTLPDSDVTDFYPIPLDRESVRPGAVFVDAGGHVILVSQLDPQTPKAMGALYGVDSHPDRTVTHKAFGPGTFVFNHRVPTDGFKAFRPVIYEDGKIRFLTNTEINQIEGLTPHSMSQTEIDSSDAFYHTMNRALNPSPVDPKNALMAKIEVLHRAMQERAEAVQIGVEYMVRNGWKKMSMPDGPAIFQTTGPWETYSTPARDMRCFLAIDDAMTFPDRVVKNAGLYDISPKTDLRTLKQSLIELRDKALASRTIDYTRSDGSTWTLTLMEIVSRQKDLEMAYNPNDCPETRWAAPKDSEEFSSCHRRAPPDQRFKMRLARPWFESRRRPDQR